MTNQLPDLDSLTPEELEKLANEAREDMSASSEIWLIVSEVTTQEKIAIASVLLLRQIPEFIRFSFGRMAEEHSLIKAYELSKQITNGENRVALAADILQSLIPYEDDVAITELITMRGIETLRGNEIKEALNQGDINKAFQLAAVELDREDVNRELRLANEAEAIKDEFYAGHPAY